MRNWLNSGISERRNGAICVPDIMPLFLQEGCLWWSSSLLAGLPKMAVGFAGQATRLCSQCSGVRRFESYKGHLLNSHANHKFAAVALRRAEVLEPIAVDEGGCAAPGVVDPDAVEHGRDLAEELLLARCPCLGFNLPQRPLGLFLEVVQRQQRVSFHLTLEIPPYVPPVLAHQ